jgi:NDP-sugar pyrophosphorylase family protein
MRVVVVRGGDAVHHRRIPAEATAPVRWPNGRSAGAYRRVNLELISEAVMASLADIDVIVLAGGRGLRLEPVTKGEVPKFLVPFLHDVPFGKYFLDGLREQGFRRIIMALASGAEQIICWLDAIYDQSGLDIVYSVEDEPAGTASAVRAALQLVGSETFVVMNGDTLIRTDLNLLSSRSPQAAIRSVFSLVRGQRICAGVHFISHRALPYLMREMGDPMTPEEMQRAEEMGQRTLEPILSFDDRITAFQQHPPLALGPHPMAGFLSGWPFYDIGTPEGFDRARTEWLK